MARDPRENAEDATREMRARVYAIITTLSWLQITGAAYQSDVRIHLASFLSCSSHTRNEDIRARLGLPMPYLLTHTSTFIIKMNFVHVRATTRIILMCKDSFSYTALSIARKIDVK